MDEFLAGAHSVFSFIQATAEPEGGGSKWQTRDYYDKCHYHFSIFNGVGGIPIFLGAYYKQTQSPAALDLARGAIEWCIHSEPENFDFQRGLQMGKTGVAYSALYLSELTGEEWFSDFRENNARSILASEPGPITDLVGGEASNGWFLLKLWNRVGNSDYLNGAIRCAKWISRHLQRDELGTYCLVDPEIGKFGPIPYSGLAHGIAGVAHFFAVLFDATQDEQWKDVAYELLRTLVRHGISDKGGLNWSPKLGTGDLSRCQYSHGAAGIGLIFTRAARIFGDSNLLEVAVKAGETTYQYGDFRRNPTLCTGLAGGGELLVELFRESQDVVWLRRAEEFARQALSYKVTIEDKDYWPTDTAGCFSADFTYGASGTGYFLLRTSDPMKFDAPLL